MEVKIGTLGRVDLHPNGDDLHTFAIFWDDNSWSELSEVDYIVIKDNLIK